MNNGKRSWKNWWNKNQVEIIHFDWFILPIKLPSVSVHYQFIYYWVSQTDTCLLVNCSSLAILSLRSFCQPFLILLSHKAIQPFTMVYFEKSTDFFKRKTKCSWHKTSKIRYLSQKNECHLNLPKSSMHSFKMTCYLWVENWNFILLQSVFFLLFKVVF